MKQRVVVTGMGVMTSLGSDLDEFWGNLMEGKSGVSHNRSIRCFRISNPNRS